MTTLNIIGCGKVAKVLGRLFHQAAVFEIGDLASRSPGSAADAARFIGAGRPVSSLRELAPADLFLIATSDDAIAGCARELADASLVGAGSVVWHLSGALPSSVLQPVQAAGAMIASVHPVKTFPDPSRSVTDFPGTFCGIEGDRDAVELLSQAFGRIGGRIFPVDTAFKSIYHAGSVVVCNYLTALLEVGARCYEKGGVPREVAFQVMEPLVRGTVDNVFRTGTEEALTGPIARGDSEAVGRQLEALEGWNAEVAALYRALGKVALDLGRRRLSDEEVERLAKLMI
ncbi:NAD-dependent glycerol-3-phosphate dehydrogenase [Geomonas sp. Red276]